jgi:hypothetical protein
MEERVDVAKVKNCEDPINESRKLLRMYTTI